jgi:hypothetical protein
MWRAKAARRAEESDGDGGGRWRERAEEDIAEATF